MGGSGGEKGAGTGAGAQGDRPKRTIKATEKARRASGKRKSDGSLPKAKKAREEPKAPRCARRGCKKPVSGNSQFCSEDCEALAGEEDLLGIVGASEKNKEPSAKKKRADEPPKKKAAPPAPSPVASEEMQKRVRDTALTSFTAALSAEPRPDGTQGVDAASVATAVEKALFALYGEASKDYRNKFRSLLFNFKDASNPMLRRRVLLGEVRPDPGAHHQPSHPSKQTGNSVAMCTPLAVGRP